MNRVWSRERETEQREEEGGETWGTRDGEKHRKEETRREQADRERARETPPKKSGKAAERKGIRAGALGRGMTAPFHLLFCEAGLGRGGGLGMMVQTLEFMTDICYP